MAEHGYWSRMASQRTTRRGMLRASATAGLGLGAAALIGCGEDEEEAAPRATPTAGGAGTATATATATAAAEQPKQGGTFITASTNAISDVLDPHVSLSAAWGQWMWMGNVAVQRTRDAKELEGQVVESWEIPGDGTEMLLKVRPNVKWHNKPPIDGRVLDAEDIVYNLERITGKFDAENIGRYQRRSTLEGMTGAEAVDDHTVKVTFDRPRGTFLWGLSDGRNSLVPRDFIDKGGKFEDSQSLVGSGPFVMEKFQDEVSIRYVRNPDYWKPGVPHLDAVEYVWVPDRTSHMAALSQGQVDYFTGPNLVERETLKKFGGGLQEQIWPESVLWQHWRFNTKVKPFDDPRVRRALHLVPDYKAIGDAFYGEDYWRFSGPLASGYSEGYTSDEIAQKPGWNPKTKEQDTKTAKELMDAAGYPDGEFAWKILLNSNVQSAFAYDSAVRAMDRWKAVWPKLDVSLDLPPDNATFAKRQASREGWDTIAYVILGQPDAVLDLTSQYHTKGSRNYGNFSDAEVDSLLEQASAQLDGGERQKTLDTIQDLLINEHMSIITILVYLQTAWFSPRMRGIHEVYGLETSFELGQRGSDFMWIAS